MLDWLAATIFFAVLFLRLPPRIALITGLVAILLFPTLQMISFQPNGSVDAAIDRLRDSAIGVWGWPNAMRYIGVFASAMLFPAVAAICGPERRASPGWRWRLLFGFCCYVSQENLIGGLVAIGALALLLVVSQTIPARMTVSGRGFHRDRVRRGRSDRVRLLRGQRRAGSGFSSSTT